MTSRTNLKAVAAAFVLAVSAAGCGDDPENEAKVPATTPATSPGTSPVTFEPAPTVDASKPIAKKDASWAKELCTSMVGRMEAIRPPTVAASSPEATLKSLTTFFTSVVEQQGGQLSALEDVGAPPEDKAKPGYEKAVSELRDVRKSVGEVVDNLKASDADSEQEVTALIGTLQQQLASLSSYGGPVKALYADDAVGNALLAEPACEKVG